MVYLFGLFILKTVGIRSPDILGHAAVDDAGTYLGTTHLPTDNSEEYNEKDYEIEAYTFTTLKILPTMVLTMILTSTLLNYLPTYLPLLGVFLTLVPIATSLTTNPGLKIPTLILSLQHRLPYMGYLAPSLQLNNVLLEIRPHLYARQPKIMFYHWDG
jgi:hypothetical protein